MALLLLFCLTWLSSRRKLATFIVKMKCVSLMVQVSSRQQPYITHRQPIYVT